MSPRNEKKCLKPFIDPYERKGKKTKDGWTPLKSLTYKCKEWVKRVLSVFYITEKRDWKRSEGGFR